MFAQNDTEFNTASTEASNLVEAILLLHSLAASAADIARRLRVEQITVLHAIRHGRLPQRQLSFAWADVTEARQ